MPCCQCLHILPLRFLCAAAVSPERPCLLLMVLRLPAHMPAGTLQPRKPHRRVRDIGAGGSPACTVPSMLALGSMTNRSRACSAGNHAPGQSVTWTGSLGARQKVVGLTLNWCVLHSMLWRSGVVVANPPSAGEVAPLFLQGLWSRRVQSAYQRRWWKFPGGRLLAQCEAPGGLVQRDGDV